MGGRQVAHLGGEAPGGDSGSCGVAETWEQMRSLEPEAAPGRPHAASPPSSLSGMMFATCGVMSHLNGVR